MKKINIAILGATGNVGQRFVQLLHNHPWFNICEVCASEKNVGKKYKDVVNWKVSDSIPLNVQDYEIKSCTDTFDSQVMFSALDSSVAGEIEEEFAKSGHIVISNAKNHRMVPDVPLLIPEVNPEHLSLIEYQKKRLKSTGFIVTNPNCTTVGLTLALKPLLDSFGISQVIVSSFQALSGAGYPGVPSLDALDNVIPYIEGEEEKLETEPLKLLSTVKNHKLVVPKVLISAHCNRVMTRDGHLENVTVELQNNPTVEQIIATFTEFKGVPQYLHLPSAPKRPIIYRPENDRPQPYLDRNVENGMAVTIGRIRSSNIFSIKFTLLVHNTLRGAAGAAVLNAELLKVKGLL